MHMILWHLARAGALLCLARSVNATSFQSEHPHHVVRLEDIAWSSPTITQGHPEHVQLSFRLQDQPARQVMLDLERNDDIYEQPLQTRHLDQHGAVAAAETIPARSHLAFRGRATSARHDNRPRGGLGRAAAAGWARLTVFVKDGVQLGEGAFSLDGVEYHVQPDYVYSRAHGSNPLPLDHRVVPTMIAWREEVDGEDGGGGNAELRRRSTSNETCSVADVDFNLGQMGLGGARGSSSSSSHLAARQNSGGDLNSLDLGGLIGSTAGCPGTRQIALLGIATDCSYTAQFNSTDDLRQHLLSVVNTASRLYEQSFNIALRLQNLTVSDANCPRTGSGSGSSTPWNLACSGSGSGSTGSVGISTRLSLFTDWRRGLGADGNAVWSLLTTCNSGSTVGIAWIGTVCNGARASGGSRQGTLGANVVSSCDAGARYIMNPASTTTMTEFSPCTIGTICTAMGRNFVRTNCLSGNDNVTTISSGITGADYLDGTPCGGGGDDSGSRFCYSGECRASRSRGGAGGSSDAASWISRNKAVFIVVVVVAALLVLLVAWWCVSCVRRRSARRVEETNSARLAALRAHQQQQQQPPAMAARQPIASGSPVVLPLPPSRRPVYPHRYA
ncbi:ADAM protease ADM-B [Moelleriella libera RCEF 2490]|uniref:ADAM protease ADM-B n=1 Tax=Moelleriella libera RCEF 2490 TaxID=1081109 RepID=A0A168ELG4_9HYPO|nr:ADAM protease ADM-B [Moelleriella libera RCEF 2490]